MSSSTPESTRRVERKRSASPIRKYLTSSPSSPKKPLASVNDNVQEKASEETKKEELHQSRFIDYYKTTKKSSIKSDAKSIERPPTLKRSHSAISSLDTVNESWMNSPLKSRQSSLDKKETYDRLTPGITDMPSAQLMMKSTQDISNNGSESYQVQIAKAVGLDPSKRVLTFKPEPPIPRHNIRKNAPQVKLSTHTSTHIKRHILLTPEKILDAPFMVDDYYFNVLDWSKNNVVAVGLDKSVYLWNADNGTIQSLNYDQDDQVASLNWSGDGSYLAVGNSSGETQIWDVKANTRLRTMKGQDSRIGVLAWDKHLVSSGAHNGTIYDHDVRMAKHVVRVLRGHTGDVCGLKWRWDGESLASGGDDDTVNIWDARSTQPKFQRRSHKGAIKALAWCPWNRNLLATGGGLCDKKIHFWNTNTGLRVNTIDTGAQVTSLHWSQHYKEIVSTHGLPHNQVSVWGYPTLNKLIDIPGHESRILHSAMSPDGQVLATAAADENLKFWRIFEADGKARLATEINRSTTKREVELRKCQTLR